MATMLATMDDEGAATTTGEGGRRRRAPRGGRRTAGSGRVGAPSASATPLYPCRLYRTGMLHPHHRSPRPRPSPGEDAFELEDAADNARIRTPRSSHFSTSTDTAADADTEEPTMRTGDEREEEALLQPQASPGE